MLFFSVWGGYSTDASVLLSVSELNTLILRGAVAFKVAHLKWALGFRVEQLLSELALRRKFDTYRWFTGCRCLDSELES